MPAVGCQHNLPVYLLVVLSWGALWHEPAGVQIQPGKLNKREIAGQTIKLPADISCLVVLHSLLIALALSTQRARVSSQ